MKIKKIIEDIEEDFLEGAGTIILCGFKDVNELNKIKEKFEEQKYTCNLCHENYVIDGMWPYKLEIFK